MPALCLQDTRGQFSLRPSPHLTPSVLPTPPPQLPAGSSSVCALSLRRGSPAQERQRQVLPAAPSRAWQPSPLRLSSEELQRGARGVTPVAGHQWPSQPSAPGGPWAPTQPGHPWGCWQRLQHLQAQAVRWSMCYEDQLSLSLVTIKSPQQLPKPDLGGLGLKDGQ